MKKFAKGLLISLLAAVGALCLLLAACGKEQVTLNFITEGDPIESVSLEVGEEYTLPVPERADGWQFEGWYLDAGFMGDPVERVVAEQDTTFYAKWTKTYAVTFDLDGGTLSAGDLYLKAGENISEYMKDRIPQKAGGFEFGEWLYEGRTLSSNVTMPSSDITLTAHWKVQYTVHLYLQKLVGAGVTEEYEAGEDYVGYEYPMESYTVAPQVEGFTAVEHAGSKPTGALTKTPADNVFTLYLNRNLCTVFFRSNYPTETHLSDSDRTVQAYYGQEIVAPTDYFSLNGYLQVGWGTSSQGEAEYMTDSAMALVQNPTREPTPDTITVRGDVVLFANWSRGYIDMFGSGDTVYRFSDDSTEVYLRRGDIYFVGEYRAARGTFDFNPGNGQRRTGKFNADGTFAYSEGSRVGTRYLYEVGVGINMGVLAAFDSYNGITYTRIIDNTPCTAKGSYQITSDGLYLVTFETADPLVIEMLDKQWTMRIGTATVDNDGVTQQVNCFQFRNDEDYRLGTIPRAGVNRGQIGIYNFYQLTLDGFGTATYQTESGAATYSYIYDAGNETIRLISTSGTETVARILQLNGTNAYMIYDEAFAHEYTSSTGATLELDGLYRAYYSSAQSGQMTGYYTLSESVFGTLVTMYVNGSDYKTYLVRTIEEPAYDEEGKQIIKYYYRFDEKRPGYSEWHYYDAEAETGYYYAPLLVLNESEEGKAGLYGYTAEGTYVKVADGSYAPLDGGHYSFTVDENTRQPVVVMTTPYDLSTIKSFVFELSYGVDPSYGYYPVMFWTSYTDTNSEIHAQNTTVYRSSEEGNNDTITTIEGTSFMVYSHNNETLIGYYSTDEDGITALHVRDEGIFYFHLDPTGGDEKFTVLNGFFGWLTLYAEDGQSNSDIRIFLDGAGGAKYVERADGEVTKQIEGTYTYSDDKVSEVGGRVIYTFTPKETADISKFDFITIEVANSTRYFAKKNETIVGKEYTNAADASTLFLDGFGYKARLTTADGTETNWFYVVMDADEKVIALIASTGDTASSLFYELTVETGKFTTRGNEYALYYLINNGSSVDETYIRLNGDADKTAKVYNTTKDIEEVMSEDELTLVGTGTYSAENGVYTLVYTPHGQESDSVTLIGVLGTVSIGSTPINAFFIRHEEVASSYVNSDDFSVITLNDHGNATYVDGKGAVQNGQYKIINEKLFYFENSTTTDAAIYEYDKAKASAKPLHYDETAYYTDNLEAMIFTSYGFMLLDGTDDYYYSVDKDGNVTLYHQDFSLPQGDGVGQRNGYGFTAESFGTFEPTKAWGEADKNKTYYKHDGYAVDFKRDEASKDNYPVKLQGVEEKVALENLNFSPTGSAEFDAPGFVKITLPETGTKQLSCTVHRYKDGEEYKMYLTTGTFRFDIDVTFSGSDSTQNKYSITSMKSVVEADSYLYLYYAFVYLYTQGVVLDNNFGTITITDTYNTAGDIEADGQKVTGEFFINSGLADLNGDYLNFTDEAYTYSEDEGLFTVDFAGKDGQQYRLRFALTTFLNSYAYRIAAMTRIQTLELPDSGDGTAYSLEVERIIATELEGYNAGDIYTAALTVDGAVKEPELMYERDGEFYYYVRERDAAADENTLGKITSSVLYVIKLKDRALDSSTAGSDGKVDPDSEEAEAKPTIIPLFDSFTLEKHILTVAYDEDQTSYVEYYKAGSEITIVHFNRAGRDYLLTSGGQEKNADGSYTVHTTAGTSYKITIDDTSGTATATFEIIVE